MNEILSIVERESWVEIDAKPKCILKVVSSICKVDTCYIWYKFNMMEIHDMKSWRQIDYNDDSMILSLPGDVSCKSFFRYIPVGRATDPVGRRAQKEDRGIKGRAPYFMISNMDISKQNKPLGSLKKGGETTIFTPICIESNHSTY